MASFHQNAFCYNDMAKMDSVLIYLTLLHLHTDEIRSGTSNRCPAYFCGIYMMILRVRVASAH
jgi:hypothetical protein